MLRYSVNYLLLLYAGLLTLSYVHSKRALCDLFLKRKIV